MITEAYRQEQARLHATGDYGKAGAQFGEVVADMLRAHDYQLWIERVDVSGKVGIVMQDGEALPDPFEEPVPTEEFRQGLKDLITSREW